MKRRILFVDAEPNMQRALRRMFHSKCDLWDMSFASDGRQAMDMLSAAPIDIIVCDLHLPDMDGIELLTRVKANHPHAVRIIFSGDIRLDTSMQTVRLAHQYIAKPADTHQIEATIHRACMIKDLLDDDSLRRRIAGLETLPVLPDLYTQIVTSLTDPQGSVGNAGMIVARDMAMTAKILQLVNSAFFCLAREVTSPSEAVVYLGLDIIRALVLTIGIFNQFSGSGVPTALFEQLYMHSMQTGTLAREIALAADLSRRQADDAFTAGLLHDLGKLVIACNPSDPATAPADAPGQGAPTRQDEHGPIGGYLIGLWGLPISIVEAVAFHHAPGSVSPTAFDIVGIVHVADALLNHVSTDNASSEGPNVDMAYLEALGMTPYLDSWLALAEKTQVAQ
jgi:HD-like signal output (HDOD) protein/ActR/RegA family two-component response regulator